MNRNGLISCFGFSGMSYVYLRWRESALKLATTGLSIIFPWALCLIDVDFNLEKNTLQIVF